MPFHSALSPVCVVSAHSAIAFQVAPLLRAAEEGLGLELAPVVQAEVVRAALDGHCPDGALEELFAEG